MAFCMNCGKKIEDGRSLCPECERASGKQAHKASRKPSESKRTERVLSKNIPSATSLFTSVASPVSGETAAGILSPATELINIANPFIVFFRGIKRIITGFVAVFKDKKKLIPALVLAVLWIVLSLLSMLGVQNTAIKTLSLLTFAEGGYSGSIAGVIGGLLGKGMVATVFISLFSGGFKGVTGGVKQTFASFKNTACDTAMLCSFVFGAGVSMIFYNFITERAVIWQSMAGIAGLFICLRALGNRNGFLRNFLTSVTAKRINGGKTENTKVLTPLLSGMSYGFALAVPVSLIPFVYTPYCLGVLFIAASLALIIVRRFDKEGEVK